MRKSNQFLALIAAAVLLGACSAPTPVANTNAVTANTPPVNRASPEVTPNPELQPVATLADGKELYALNCMICHKDTGKGGRTSMQGKTINPDDLTSAKMKAMSDEKLIGYVANGIEDEGMPAFKDKLTADEIKAVIAHVRTLQN